MILTRWTAVLSAGRNRLPPTSGLANCAARRQVRCQSTKEQTPTARASPADEPSAQRNDADARRQALPSGDAAAAFAIDYELTAWWCPECEKSYCGEHWQHWAVYDPDYGSSLDYIQGWCPQGARTQAGGLDRDHAPH